MELTQEIFNGQPPEVDWAGVDYDGLLSFGKAKNPRYTWASERWRGFKLIGEPIEKSGYEPLTSIKRDRILFFVDLEKNEKYEKFFKAVEELIKHVNGSQNSV